MLKSWPIMADVNFYPRPPRGGRPEDNGTSGDFELISIHALREEGDRITAGRR